MHSSQKGKERTPWTHTESGTVLAIVQDPGDNMGLEGEQTCMRDRSDTQGNIFEQLNIEYNDIAECSPARDHPSNFRRRQVSSVGWVDRTL